MGKQLVAALVVVGVGSAVLGTSAGAVGSGDAPPSTIPATTTTSTTVTGAPPPPPAPPVERSEADADEPLCVTHTDPPDGTEPDGGPPLAVFESAMSIVNTYGVPLGEEFHGTGLTWADDGRRVVIAAFVADVAEHRDALLDLVDHPDRLVVCRARLTRSEGAAIVAAIEPQLAEFESAFGPTGMDGRVDVDIRAGNEAVAESLHAELGDRIAITVGAFPYPMPEPMPEPVCPDLPDTSDDLPYAVDDPDPVVLVAFAGVETNVDVSFVNATSEPISLMTGVPQMYLTDPRSGDVVGVPNASVGFRSVGVSVDLGPGESHDQSVRVPTASCDPALGHTLPPGDYHLYAVNGADPGDDFAVGPVPITLTAP